MKLDASSFIYPPPLPVLLFPLPSALSLTSPFPLVCHMSAANMLDVGLMKSGSRIFNRFIDWKWDLFRIQDFLLGGVSFSILDAGQTLRKLAN